MTLDLELDLSRTDMVNSPSQSPIPSLRRSKSMVEFQRAEVSTHSPLFNRQS